jgi:hypothetical protein
MWNTDTFWVEVAVVTIFFLLGHIYFGHFEERSPKWRKLLKYIVTLAIIICISNYAGRIYAFGLFGLALIPVIYIHGVILPKKGINGWDWRTQSQILRIQGMEQRYL